jgi:hypothetical protein
MMKKDKVRFQHSDDLEAVDTELANAMESLDKANERVGETLRAYDPPPPEAPAGTATGDRSPGNPGESGVSHEPAAPAE